METGEEDHTVLPNNGWVETIVIYIPTCDVSWGYAQATSLDAQVML